MHNTPVEHPAAWTGGELLQSPQWLTTLSPDDQAEITAALDHSRRVETHAISADDFPLPALSRRLGEISDGLETGVGAAIIRGLDVSSHSRADAQRIFAGLTAHLGTAVSQSAAGEKIFSVRDAGHAENDARTRGPNTRKKLSFHTDRCDVIAFLCLQQARSGGENQIVSSMTVFNEILNRRPDLMSVLQQPFLYKRHNVDTGNARAYCEQPIFSFCEGHFACAFLRVLIDRAYASADTPEITGSQREALDLVETVAADPRLQVRLTQQPGDILLLNNWVTLHRRTEFEDWPEPSRKRHILRIWLSMPNSRPLDPLFEANYGSVEAGAIRGGMPALGS